MVVVREQRPGTVSGHARLRTSATTLCGSGGIKIANNDLYLSLVCNSYHCALIHYFILSYQHQLFDFTSQARDSTGMPGTAGDGASPTGPLRHGGRKDI